MVDKQNQKNGFNNLTISLVISGILLTALIIFSIGFFIQSKKKGKK